MILFGHRHRVTTTLTAGLAAASFFLFSASTVALAQGSIAPAAPSPASKTGYVAATPGAGARIVLQFDPATGTGFDWAKLKDRTPAQLSETEAVVVHAVRYLREALLRMTGRDAEISSGNDLPQGIVITTLEAAPAAIRSDAAVTQALANTGEDMYNPNEAFYIRTEPKRALLVANTAHGLLDAAVELLESIEYEVLGLGPNWTHVPDYTARPLVFSYNGGGRPGFGRGCCGRPPGSLVATARSRARRCPTRPMNR